MTWVFFFDCAVSIALGAFALSFGMRVVRIRLVLLEALWMSAIPLVFSLPVGIGLGFVLKDQWLFGFAAIVIFQFFFEAFLLRVNARRHSLDVSKAAAYITALIYVVTCNLAAPFVASAIFDALQGSAA